MAFQKREKKQEGTKFLFFGEAGSGKTPTGLSFPKIALVDSDSGTNFYDDSNVVVDESTLSFKELKDSLDELEMDDDLFNEIETFAIDSITRFHENMVHAMNKVAERRAKDAGRSAEAEGLSFREYGKMKNYYDEFFARMLNYAKQGKNIVFISEQKDKSENVGGEIRKIGVIPNAQKDIEYDFDIVVRTFNDGEGNPKGKIIKDRTKTFKIGEEIDKPNYELWKEAIEGNLKGKKRDKSEIKSLKDTVSEEMNELDEGEGLQSQVKDIADKLIKEGRTEEIKAALEAEIGTFKYKSVTDTTKLKAALVVLRELDEK